MPDQDHHQRLRVLNGLRPFVMDHERDDFERVVADYAALGARPQLTVPGGVYLIMAAAFAETGLWISAVLCMIPAALVLIPCLRRKDQP